MEIEYDLFDFYFSMKKETESSFEEPTEFKEIKLSMKRANFIFNLLNYEPKHQQKEFYSNYIQIIKDFFEPIETCFEFEFVQWIFHHERESILKNFYFLSIFPIQKEYFEIKQFRKTSKISKEEIFFTQPEIEEKVKNNF
eukprot:gene8303-127_t